MKSKFLLLALSSFFFYQTQAQLFADAGPDITGCTGTTVVLGGNPTAFGGNSPYTYAWSPASGLNNPTLANPILVIQIPGWYYVTVTDSWGATATDSVFVNASNIFVNGFATDVLCNGGNDGSVFVTVTGGTAGYTYSWSNASNIPNPTNLSAGNYTLTVTDALGCSGLFSATVLEPAPIVASVASFNESFSGACDGYEILSVTGGAAPYSFLWSNANTAQNINGLCSGTYQVIITDANNCSVSANAVIGSGSCSSNTINLSIQSQDLSCVHPLDTMTAMVSGGNPPYSFSWSNGAATQSIILNQPGSFMVWVVDDSGCVKSAIDTLFDFGISIQSQHIIPASCNGVPDGEVHVTITGATPPYTYLWSNGATADSIVGIGAGTYTLTVTDAALCNEVFNFIVAQNSTNFSYYVFISSTSANCSNNGIATAIVGGGVPPFTFLWSTGDTTQTASNLAPGIYSVTVSDNGGCMRTGSTYIYTSCYNIIQGRIINDFNGNCVLDSGETPLAFVPVIADGANDYYGNTDAQGYYTIFAVAGTYTIHPYYYTACVAPCNLQNASYTQTFPTLGDTAANVNFYLVQPPFDLYVYPSWNAFRPGFIQTVYLYYGNAGTDTVNGTLTFTYDSDLTFVSAANGGVHNATNHTVTWSFADIAPAPYYSYYYYNYYYYNYVTADFLTPIATPIGTPITNTTNVSGPTSECDTLNNNFVITTFVTNSLDPNEKEVSPAGNIFDEDSVLTYTIHFQNTGNDTAWFVVLKDTLSPNLEAASVQNISSSHTITDFKIEGEGILTWVFNPIYLVDSATNPEGSEGYVMFRIKKKNGLPIGTTISNKASIYFDYNEPVVTNTVTNTIADPNYIFETAADDIRVSAFPNPFKESTKIVVDGLNSKFNFSLFDVTGRMVKKISSIENNQFELKRGELTSGVYFYKISAGENRDANGKLVVE